MSIYAQSTLGTLNNQIIFNNNTVFPVYRIISRAPQQRQVRDLDIPIPFESGISDFQTLIGKTAYIIEGIMYPGSESQYDQGLRKLRKLASLDYEQNDAFSDNGYVPYVFQEFNSTKQIFLKVLYVEIPENTRKGLVQPFRLICKIKDPTIYGGTLKQASTQVADFTQATGTAVYPFTFPIIYGAYISSVSTDANNLGDIAGYPISINIHGPVTNPKFINTTTGEYIQVNTSLPTDDNELIIAYDKDTLIVTVDGDNKLDLVSSGSTYFKIRPGSNIFQLTGSSVNTGSYGTISYYDTYALS